MDNSQVLVTVLTSVLTGMSIELILYKIQTKLTWKQVIAIKYKVLIIAPMLNLVSKRIAKKRKSLGRLCEIRNRLNEKLMNI